MHFRTSNSTFKTLSALFDAPLVRPSANLGAECRLRAAVKLVVPKERTVGKVTTAPFRADRREGLSHTERLNFAGAKTRGRELRAGFSITVL